MRNFGHRTAIIRRGLSQPATRLLDNNLLRGRILDHGCGRGEDWRLLKKAGYNIEGYDPYWRPRRPHGPFEVITSTYVANVLPSDRAVEHLIAELLGLLSEEGLCYLSVRRDLPKQGLKGRGCRQRYVELKADPLFEGSSFATYRIPKTAQFSVGRRNDLGGA